MSDLGGLLPDLGKLWRQTLGDPDIRIAVLDGPVESAHPCFSGAILSQTQPAVKRDGPPGLALRHGTHIASILFGQPGSPVHGVTPRCTGLIIPIFEDQLGRQVPEITHRSLAQAIQRALEQGAHIVNISACDAPQQRPIVDPQLSDVIERCADAGVLVIGAAGNNGCDCAVNPAALPWVLVAGAMGPNGLPLKFSNWGALYQDRGLLAPGEKIPGAVPGGSIGKVTGTSQATAILSGVAALLMSLQLRWQGTVDAAAIRDALLSTALDCAAQPAPNCRQLLKGRVNIPGVMTRLFGTP